VDQVLADTPLPSPKGHPVSKLIAESSRGTVEAVESIRNTAETLAPLAPVVDELPPLLPRPELTGDLLDFLTPAAIEALPLPSGPSQEAGSTSESGALDLSQPPRPDVFSHWSAIDPGGSFRKYLVAHGAIETVALGPSSSPSTSENALAAADRFGPTFTGSAAGRSGGHTPLDVPLPARATRSSSPSSRCSRCSRWRRRRFRAGSGRARTSGRPPRSSARLSALARSPGTSPGLRREPDHPPAKSKLKHGRNYRCDIPRL
jgi:hypothetical protein